MTFGLRENIRFRLFGFLLLLHETQDVEMLDLALREETVDRLLLLAEDLEDRGKFGEQQQLYVPAVEMNQLQMASGLLQSRVTDNHRSEASAVDVIHLAEIENEILVTVHQFRTDLVARQGASLAGDKPAV